MPLEPTQTAWISAFTANAVKFPRPIGATNDPMGDLRDDLRARQAEEALRDQALKEAVLAKVFKVIDARKEEIREACDMIAKVKSEDGKVKDEKFKDKGGQAQSFDASQAGSLAAVPEGLVSEPRKIKGKDQVIDGETIEIYTPHDGERAPGDKLPDVPEGFFEKTGELDATSAYAIIVEQKDVLAGKKVERSVLDEKAGLIVTATQPLFTDDEIEKELYTPLVRDMVLPDTLINDLYSNTQKMIDGSNEYYVNECREKGKQPASSGLALAKGAVQLGATVAQAVISGLAPVADGMQGTAGGDKLSKEQAAKASAITTGVAALLTAGLDVADGIDEMRKTGDFSAGDYTKVINGIALGIGKVVAGSTGDANLGLAVTDGITAGAGATSLVPTFVNWQKKGGPPPVGEIIGAIGTTISSSFNVKSDKTSDADPSTKWAQAGAGVGAAFKVAAAAADAKLVTSFQKGEWKEVFGVLLSAGNAAAGAVPTMVAFAKQYNALDGSDPTNPNQTAEQKTEKLFQDQQKLLKSMDALSTQTDAFAAGADALLDQTAEDIAKAAHLEGKIPAQSQKQLDAMKKEFEARKTKLDAQTEQAFQREVESVQEELDREKEEYRAALTSLGSATPDDAEYKSIATLIAKIERDRAIWNGLYAMFGAGLSGAASIAGAEAVAATVVPGLKIAGQLVKFAQNLQAAADRLEAWLDWKEARKDAASAVSPYATSIQNFVSNQGSQFTQYTVQASANIIQALLNVGELTPLSPAFTAASAAVAAVATAEDLVYKFNKQQALKAAWKETKEALEPKNKGNRRMALLVRQINPTLAKYTLAYGALIERSPVAVTAMNRIGLDRETLTRAGDKVADVKKYLQTLYPDDNVVLGDLGAKPGATKVPPPALTSKAWSVSHMLWTEKDGLATKNPPAIVANLLLVEPLCAKEVKDLTTEQQAQLLDSLRILENAFKSFEPRTAATAEMPPVKQKVEVYADLAYTAIKKTQFALAELAPAPP